MTLEGQIKNEDRIVSEWLMFYSERKVDYEKERKEVLYSSNPTISDGQPKGNATSDPTGRKGDKLCELQEKEQWLTLIEEVTGEIHPKMQIFLRLRQEYRHARGRYGWVAQVQWKYAEEVAKMLHKDPRDTWIESRNTFTRWWTSLVDMTAREAAKRGLI